MTNRFEQFDELDKEIILRAVTDLPTEWQIVKQRIAAMKIDLQPPPEARYKVLLKEYGLDKIAAIKAVRSLVMDLGLREAKELVESTSRGAATIREGLTIAEANEINNRLKSIGAITEIQ